MAGPFPGKYMGLARYSLDINYYYAYYRCMDDSGYAIDPPFNSGRADTLAPPARPLEENSGFLVVRTARAMKNALDARLAVIGLSASQHSIISTLSHTDGLPLTEIGRQVFLEKPAITGLVDRLENDGLVSRRRSSTDRRVINLYLTPKGHDILVDMNRIALEVDRQLVQVLSEEELAIFISLTTRIWSAASSNRNDGDDSITDPA